MKKVLTIVLVGFFSINLIGCSDADQAAISNLGKSGLVKKYSGGRLVYAGISTGKINNEAHSDGSYFADKCQGGMLVEVTGDLVITRPEKMPTCAEVSAMIQ